MQTTYITFKEVTIPRLTLLTTHPCPPKMQKNASVTSCPKDPSHKPLPCRPMSRRTQRCQHRSTEGQKCLGEHASLDGNVQRTVEVQSLERLDKPGWSPCSEQGTRQHEVSTVQGSPYVTTNQNLGKTQRCRSSRDLFHPRTSHGTDPRNFESVAHKKLLELEAAHEGSPLSMRKLSSASLGDASRSAELRAENVARRPQHRGTEGQKCPDEHARIVT